MMKPYYQIETGQGGLSKVALIAPDGARCEVTLYGAQLTSWIPAGGEESLFLSQAAVFKPGTAIRGGVPVIFPQFNEMGPLVKHGFARISAWELDGVEAGADGGVEARFSLTNSDAIYETWPHEFALEYTVRLGGRTLSMALQVANSGSSPLDFRAALHTYLRIADIEQASLAGLQGARYLDPSSENGGEVQVDRGVRFAREEFNRVYLNPVAPILVKDGERTVEVSASGFPDVVVWNPGAEHSASMGDMEPEGYRRMLCVEAAVVKDAVYLEAGESWRGEQILRVVPATGSSRPG